MKNLRSFLTLAAVALLLACPFAGQAGEPAAILKGYGKTTWGESLAEVQKVFPEGKVEPGKPSGNIDPKSPDRTLLEADQVPFYQDLVVPGSGPVHSTIYRFGKNQLFAVNIIWSADVERALRQRDIDHLIDTKYPEADRGQIRRAGSTPPPVQIAAGPSHVFIQNEELAQKIGADFKQHIDQLGQKKALELKLDEAL